MNCRYSSNKEDLILNSGLPKFIAYQNWFEVQVIGLTTFQLNTITLHDAFTVIQNIGVTCSV
jgi:hypothetical protein